VRALYGGLGRSRVRLGSGVAHVICTVASPGDRYNGACLSVGGGARTPSGGGIGIGEEHQGRLDPLADVLGLREA
jgi:hypothetical protein